MSGLPREVAVWVQSFDTTKVLRNPKWDLSNGCIIGEIFAAYYPRDLKIHCFETGNSLGQKSYNWDRLREFFCNKQMCIPFELIIATIHCKEGAAALLIQVGTASQAHMYNVL